VATLYLDHSVRILETHYHQVSCMILTAIQAASHTAVRQLKLQLEIQDFAIITWVV